jgi:predicted RNase H-like HicB family nuclease
VTEFTIVIEDAGTNYAAYAPDVPRCIATGASSDEVTTTLREAIVEHMSILRDMGEEIPVPYSRTSVIQIASQLDRIVQLFRCLLQGRVIEIAPLVAAIKGGPISVVERRAGLKTCDEIRISEGVRAHGDGISESRLNVEKSRL